MLLVGFYFGEMKVGTVIYNLIDKAITDLNGQYPFPCHDCLHKAGSNYFSCDSDHTSVHGSMFICTRKEFESRKAERENKQHWYDYEDQKALRFPPVGEVCLVLDCDTEAKIIGTTQSGYRVYQSIETGFCEMACQLSSFKPLDWDKNRKSGLQELTELINGSFITTDPEGIAKAILAAGYRKCDNKAPPTKE